MDNPQHYQPLSHALNPPQYSQPQFEEEEEEEEEEDVDEGAVEEQLEQREDDEDIRRVDTAGNGTRTETGAKHRVHESQTAQNPSEGTDGGRKRRPGRPRGSKNRRARASGDGSVPPSKSASQSASAPAPHAFHNYTPPVGPGEVHPHNQQYYEFQWRVLNLCAEFYGAAEELVKGTPPLVVAQCYQMGPGVKVDPMTMLNEAKRICDTLLSNPSRLTAHPPPPIYPIIPSYGHLPPPAPSIQPIASTSTVSNGKPAAAASSSASVITNAQNFVVSMGQPQQQQQQQPPQQPVYQPMYIPPGNGTYPTAPYYQYAGYGGYYPQAPAPNPPPPVATSSNGTANSLGSSGGNQGAWSDEETERLKKLAEDSRSENADGEGIAWDWVVEKWGNTRTRHQILIKATSLGLKESSSRGIKRRRETEAPPERPPPAAPIPTGSGPPTDAPPAPLMASASAPVSAPASTSPTPSTPATSTHASPAIRHAPAPAPPAPSSTSAPPSSASNSSLAPRSFPYPMPTVAAATSPVITARSHSSTGASDRPGGNSGSGGNYYRPRPNQTSSNSVPRPISGSGHGLTTHQYMYQPNGSRREG
ncbi:hypothetical protein BJ138DRAFT_1124276 [Hygrophoropsis aurantiaca]|uniref:Uncharacterized protein n=1 Tax=Hygrophoropsis aurantiaca TaxID=72124 RepID=A0ACB8AKZ3_9AGAM|nr:hypothetical protein BJ138DRAFT_1124276 [Hygrophoropsis aurantiaca]